MSIKQNIVIIIVAILNASGAEKEQFVRISPQHPNTATTFLKADPGSSELLPPRRSSDGQPLYPPTPTLV